MTIIDQVERHPSGRRQHRAVLYRKLATWGTFLGLCIFCWVHWLYFRLAIIAIFLNTFPLFTKLVLIACLLALLGSVLYAASTLTEGCKVTVLYLRRFRLSGTDQVMSAAIQSGLGREYRIVTSDDRSFKPLSKCRIWTSALV